MHPPSSVGVVMHLVVILALYHRCDAQGVIGPGRLVNSLDQRMDPFNAGDFRISNEGCGQDSSEAGRQGCKDLAAPGSVWIHGCHLATACRIASESYE